MAGLYALYSSTCGSISPYPDGLTDSELLAACAVVRLSLPDGCGSLARKPILRL